MDDLPSFAAQLTELHQQGKPWVVALLVDVTGSAPQNVGARMVVTEAGLYSGTIGGGKVEARVLEVAQALLKTQQNYAYYEWNLQKDIGMTCGGVVRIFLEAHRPNAWILAVFGAGHVSQALVPLLTSLPCQIYCWDPRPEWIEALPSHPRLRAEVAERPAEKVATLPKGTFLLSLTMGHAHDTPILAAALKRQAADPEAFGFLGVIGSPAKAGVLKRELAKQDIAKALLAQLHCPVGLPLGSNAPAEIAISIAAQLLQERDKRQGAGKWEQPGYRKRAEQD